MQPTDTAILLGEFIAPVGGKRWKSSWSSSSASEGSEGSRGTEKRRGDSSRGEQSGDGSGMESVGSRTLGMSLRDCLRAQTRVVQEKRVVGQAFSSEHPSIALGEGKS